MSIKHIKLSQQAREQLSRLKRHTGIDNFNVLCRWALCTSLAEQTPPPTIRIPADSNLEMTWEVFGGRYAELLLALVTQRCMEDRLGTDEETVNLQFRLHLHRGIAYLAGDRTLRSMANLLQKAQQAA